SRSCRCRAALPSPRARRFRSDHVQPLRHRFQRAPIALPRNDLGAVTRLTDIAESGSLVGPMWMEALHRQCRHTGTTKGVGVRVAASSYDASSGVNERVVSVVLANNEVAVPVVLLVLVNVMHLSLW